MTARCPLCNEAGGRLREVIATQELVYLYRKLLPSFDVSTLLVSPDIEYRVCSSCGLGFFLPPFEGSPAFYDGLSLNEWYYQQEKPEYEIARKYIGSDDNVLDIGCGTGAFSDFIPYARYLGIETNERAVESGTNRGRDIRNIYLNEFVEKENPIFDVVCCFQVLEHISDPARFIKMINRCVCVGGLLVISVPNAKSFLSFERNQPLNYPPHHVTWWTADVLENLALLCGFDVIAIKHDIVTERYAQRYLTELVLEALNRRLKRHRKMVGESRVDRMLRRGAAQLGRFLSVAVEDGSFGGYGHSVTAVFRKRDTN